MDVKPSNGREAAIRKSGKRNARRRRAIRIRILLTLFILLLTTGIVLSYTVLFPVKSISVTGKTNYTNEQIIEASDIVIDKNMFVLNTREISNTITKKLPYIGSVKVQRILPDKVKLVVEPTTAAISYFFDGNYYFADKSSKLLEKASEPAQNSLKILGTKITKQAVGEPLGFEETQTKQLIQKLYEGIKNQKLEVTSIDVSDNLKIVVQIENRITVEFGSSSDLDFKLAHLKGMLGQIDKNISGTINLKMWSKSKPQGYFTKNITSSQ